MQVNIIYIYIYIYVLQICTFTNLYGKADGNKSIDQEIITHYLLNPGGFMSSPIFPTIKHSDKLLFSNLLTYSFSYIYIRTYKPNDTLHSCEIPKSIMIIVSNRQQFGNIYCCTDTTEVNYSQFTLFLYALKG